MEKLILGLLLVASPYVSMTQSLKLLSMNDGDLTSGGVANNVGEFVNLSAYTKAGNTSAILTCFNKAEYSVLWTKNISFSGMKPHMLITEETPKASFKNLLPKNMYYMAAEIENGDFGNTDILLLKLSPSGGVIWAKSIGAAGNEELRALKSNGNGVMISGQSNSFDNEADPFYCRIDSNGQLLWSTVIYGPGKQVNGNITTLHNRYYFAGNTSAYGFGQDDMYVGKLDHKGLLEWCKIFGTSQGEGAHEIHAFDDHLYFGGVQTLSSGNKGLAILKTDTTGTIQWKYRVSGAKDDNLVEFDIINDTLYTIGITTSMGNGLKDLLITKMDLQGKLLNYTAVGGAKDEVFTRSTILPMGNHFVFNWGTKSYINKASSMLVEFDQNLNTSCQTNKAILSTTTLTVRDSIVQPRALYDKMQIMSQQVNAPSISLDSIYAICTPLSASVSPYELQHATSTPLYTQIDGNTLRIRSDTPISLQVFDINGKLILERTAIVRYHEVSLKESTTRFAVVVARDAEGNRVYKKLFIPF